MPFRRTLSALVLAAGGLALSGCVQPPPQQVVVAAPAVMPSVPVCDSRFRVVNNSTMTVRNLQFSHSNLRGWGPDQLGANMLPPGRSMVFRAANTGNYDFRDTWVNGRAIERYGVNVCAVSNVIITNSGIAVN